ncbi:hypothetical protein ACIPID_07630, partial [Cupriavidus sp. CER94]|uniref:hypothetical protein n=1 Tax=Cupriavidus sp. CER94 TaxID=3377036 RepID=UPI0038115D61
MKFMLRRERAGHFIAPQSRKLAGAVAARATTKHLYSAFPRRWQAAGATDLSKCRVSLLPILVLR